MKLREIIPNNIDEITITFRTLITFKLCDYEDVFVGIAQYKNGNLISLDGDDYSLDDEIDNYEIDEDGDLIVWY